MTKRRPTSFGGAGGMGGGGMNQQAMLKQLQKMQEDMAKAQAALAEETLEIQAGGGIVTVVITGHQRVKEIRLDTSKLDTSDSEWATDLQDLLTVAINQAIEQSQQRAAERMEAVSGGLGDMLPGGLGGLLGG